MLPKYENLEKMAERYYEANWNLRRFFKMQDILDESEVDDLVRQITKRIWANIDCKACGNCCVKISPLLDDNDQKRIAEHLRMSPEEFRKEYLTFDDEEKSWEFKDKPCRFLKDNVCMIYEIRPENCRDYPYLDKEDFSFRLIAMINRTSVCPVVFEVMNELRKEVGRLKRR